MHANKHAHVTLSAAAALMQLFSMLTPIEALAQAGAGQAVVQSQCGAASGIYSSSIGSPRALLQDQNGNQCINAQVGSVTFSGTIGTVNQGSAASGTFSTAWPTYTPNGASGITSASVSVGSVSGTQIFGAGAGPFAYKGVCNQSVSTVVYLGGSGVTSGNTGMLIGGGGNNPPCWNLTKFPGAIYGTTASGAAVVGYEFY